MRKDSALGACHVQSAPPSPASKTFSLPDLRPLSHSVQPLRMPGVSNKSWGGGERGDSKAEEQGWETGKLSSWIKFEAFYNYSGLDIPMAKMRSFLRAKVTRLLLISYVS